MEEAGYETWAVGGAVRNALLGVDTGDWDLATRAPPPVVRRLFPRTVPVGIQHGTVGVLTRQGILVEVTTFRRDVLPMGRKALVAFAETLDEDLSRRDFTINAIAWHPLREEFRDPFGGRSDLAAGILRTVGDPAQRFAEDYLRVLRGLRFSSRFRLRIEGETWKALCAAAPFLTRLSAERIREELMKILAHDPRPSGALALYGASGALEVLYPELAVLGERRRPGTGDSLWCHALLLTDALPPSRPLLRLTALVRGVAVGPEEPEGATQKQTGGGRGAEGVAALLFRLRFSNAEIREVSQLAGAGVEVPSPRWEDKELRRWLHRVDPRHLPSLCRVWLAEARLDRARWGRDPTAVVEVIRRLRQVVRSGAPLSLEQLAVGGRDLVALGMKPGPEFGLILQSLLERVLDDPSLNERETLLKEARRLWGRAP